MKLILAHQHVHRQEILLETLRVTLLVIILGTLLVTMHEHIPEQEFLPTLEPLLGHVPLHIQEQEFLPILVEGYPHTQEPELLTTHVIFSGITLEVSWGTTQETL